MTAYICDDCGEPWDDKWSPHQCDGPPVGRYAVEEMVREAVATAMVMHEGQRHLVFRSRIRTR